MQGQAAVVDAGEDAAVDDWDEMAIAEHVEHEAGPRPVDAGDDGVAVECSGKPLVAEHAVGHWPCDESRRRRGRHGAAGGDVNLEGAGDGVGHDGAKGAVEVAELDAVVVDEYELFDPGPRERLGDDAADRPEPNDGYSRAR